MKVYLKPETDSRGIVRVHDALIKYLPEGVEVVENAKESDLEIIHVYGRHDAIERRVRRLQDANKPYAMIQYALRSTISPNTSDWIGMWEKARLVWSYYDLPELCREDEMGDSFGDSYLMPGFKFYYAPLGVDPNVFRDTAVENGFRGSFGDPKLHRRFTIMATSQHALAEGTRECAFATKRVKREMLFVGHDLRRGPDIVCVNNLSDDELANYYGQCDFVSGLRRIEGFEFPVIEGALCGARPIVFDKPHYRKWFNDFAIFIPEGSRSSVIDHLESIFKENIPLVSEEEKAIIRERFDWNKIITNFWNKIL